MKCPACSKGTESNTAECPHCGLIFAKWRPAPPETTLGSAAVPTGQISTATAVLIISTLLIALGLYARKQLSAAAEAAGSSPQGDPRIIAVEDAASNAAFDDWYPADIAPPPGTQYPCALTALPRDLQGIPPSHRAYINHSYSLILKAVQAKLIVYDGLGAESPSTEALESYLEKTRELQRRLRQEAVPESLVPFRDDVLAALDLQMTFFSKAYAGRRAGEPFDRVITIPEGRQASQKLVAAWGKMSARYPAWDSATKDSIYHHLCALDLF